METQEFRKRKKEKKIDNFFVVFNGKFGILISSREKNRQDHILHTSLPHTFGVRLYLKFTEFNTTMYITKYTFDIP